MHARVHHTHTCIKMYIWTMSFKYLLFFSTLC